MSSVWKLRRDFTSADLTAVECMLGRLTDEDAAMRMSLEDRKKEIEAELANLPVDEEHHGQAAVFFGGRPVVVSLGIERKFADRAVSMIQDLVAKQFARESVTKVYGHHIHDDLRTSQTPCDVQMGASQLIRVVWCSLVRVKSPINQ